jgi:hypothetical protein
VKSPTQRNYLSPSETANDYRAFVSDYGGLGEAGYVSKSNTHDVVDRIGESAES